MDEKAALNGGASNGTANGQTVAEKKPASPEDEQTPSSNKSNVELTDRVFQFLATATPGSLAAIAACLALATFLILGRAGLVLIGAFGGIALFMQWERQNADVARVVKGEGGVELIRRLLDGRIAPPVIATKDEPDAEDEERKMAQDFDDFQPETRDALNGLVDAVVRDYVKWWYSPIIPSDKWFPLSCRKTLTSFLLSVSNHLSRKRPADAFLDFVTNSASIVIVFFTELSSAFAATPSHSNLSAADIIYNYLAANPESSLANLLSQRQQAGKLRMVAEDLLGFLDRQAYECDTVRVFLREVLAACVLEMSLQTCSKAEWINGWIVYLLEAGEPDISQAIDVGMQTGPAMENAFLDIDGNLGTISLSKGNRNSFETERARRKEVMTHKKKLSKADEEMELAMEEMKKLNEMIAEEEARRTRESVESASAPEASERLASALERNADELNVQTDVSVNDIISGHDLHVSASSDKVAALKDGSSDENSSKEDAVHTPATPHSVLDSVSPDSSPKRSEDVPFTSFDQIVPPATEDAEDDAEAAAQPERFTLHNATITVHDDPVSDKGRIRSKPSWDYLIQIEPANAHAPGWMIVRKYSDLERLHEILRRIATISGAKAFSEQHTTLPAWKMHTRASLRGELERYLRDACWFQSLAESEGMKRFLEKDNQGHGQAAGRSGLQAFENMGKNVFEALASAPKNAVEGSKAVVGNVSGVLGMGPRRSTNSSLQDVTAASRAAISTPPRLDTGLSTASTMAKSRDSSDSGRSPSVISVQPAKTPPMERRMSYQSLNNGDAADNARLSRSDHWDRPPFSARNSRDNSRASSVAALRSPSAVSLDVLGKLPPLPSEIPDDYDASSGVRKSPPARSSSMNGSTLHSVNDSIDNLQGRKAFRPAAQQHTPLSEEETRVAVELLFAIINELYTLSSAWNIRRTLLAAAKSFLLRPGNNPSLLSIQQLMQSSVLDANASDAGIATHLRKLRENTMPTEEERAAWPAELSADEREKLRVRARRLLIRSGVPAALMGVMGQSATSEALGRVFDCLQVEEVARGLMFGIMLQAVRIITH